MNIFSKLTVYAGKWNVSESRSFTEEELQEIERNEVVPSQYGNSVCFFLKRGGQTYIPLSTQSSVGVGESLDLKEAKLLTLSKQGENDILRIEA